MGNAWNMLQIQIERFVDKKFIEAAIFAENEGVVEAGDQKNVLDFERHEVVEALEACFGVEKGLGDGAGGHEWIILLQEIRGLRLLEVFATGGF